MPTPHGRLVPWIKYPPGKPRYKAYLPSGFSGPGLNLRCQPVPFGGMLFANILRRPPHRIHRFAHDPRFAQRRARVVGPDTYRVGQHFGGLAGLERRKIKQAQLREVEHDDRGACRAEAQTVWALRHGSLLPAPKDPPSDWPQ